MISFRGLIITLTILGVAPSAHAGKCDWYDGSGVSKDRPCWVLAAFNDMTTTEKDCNDARSSEFAKKYGCSNGPDEGSSSSFGDLGGLGTFCGSNSDCFGLGSGTQGAGIGQFNKILSSLNNDSDRLHEIQGKRLESAAATLEKWQKNLGTPASKNQGDITGLNKDRALVSKALDSYSGKGKFDSKDADSATDPSVKNHLSHFAEEKALEDAFREEITKREKDRAKLQQMMAKTDGRGDNLSSISKRDKNADPEPGSRSPASQNDAEKEANAKLTSGIGRAGGGSGSGITSKSDSSISSTLSAKSGDSLRARISEELSKKRKGGSGESGVGKIEGDDAAAETLESASFQKNITPSDGSDITDAKGAFLKDVLAPTQKFAMTGSETDREVRRLLDGAMQSQPGGVMEKESGDLFARVHQAHKQCLIRECVGQQKR